ncbi:MAG TPA: serine/threonine-protein kinase [Kofleriaceae bacterium]
MAGLGDFMDPQGPAQQQDLLIGQTVGNYLVTQKLGEGGMGAVYLAEHPTIGKKVALKVLHAEFSQNPEVAERFFNEAKAVNAIQHPNIVDIVDYGVLQTGPRREDQLVYFIMEFLAGQTLSQIIRAEAPLPPERALSIALQVADALAASHKQMIVHRDLKPDNIILITRGREKDFVKLLDFGIAKLTNDSRGSHRTRTGLVLGTPAYMSPEQCEGRANVDHRTDIYALGICLYEMLVGRVPFIGEGYGEILVQHLTQKPVEPSRYRMMSPHVEVVVMKALEKRPEMRYPTMDEFIRALADPVGYVEANGGVQGFLGRQLMPSSAPLPPARLTPAPLSIPGVTGVYNSPVPGSLSAPSPTTLSGGAGQPVGAAPGRNKTGFIVAGVGVVVAAAIGIAVVAGSKKKTTNDNVATGSGSAEVVVATKPPEPPPQPPPPQPQPPPPQPAVGSAVVATVTPDAAVKPIEATVAKTVDIALTSTPDGAEIYLNNVDTGKRAPATLTLPEGGKPAQITLKLHGYADVVLTNVALDSGDLKKDVALKKIVTQPTTQTQTQTQQTQTHQTTQTQKPHTTKPCDTCLEPP